MAPGYGYFGDEFYTIALSRHLALGYVDLPPLAPLLVAISQALLGDSLFAFHIVPALAGAVTLVFACQITKEFGGKAFAAALTALAFIAVPIWLSLDSIFCYDSIDQMILAGFLLALVRFLKTGNKRLWLVMGLIAGIASLTKMTILFLGPGFLVSLLLSKYRKDLLTRWPYLGAVIYMIVISPYVVWQWVNHWPTLEYWMNYGTIRVYQASLQQYLLNAIISMNLFLIPLWILGLYRLLRRMDGVSYRFFIWLFLVTFGLLFVRHATIRLLAELFIPLIAAAALCIEELLSHIRSRWQVLPKVLVGAYLVFSGLIMFPISLPIIPPDRLSETTGYAKPWIQATREFNGGISSYPELLVGRVGWDDLVKSVAQVYNDLPAEDRQKAGIYAYHYMFAGAIDVLGPQYGLPHAVSGSLTYYLWGPGYSWDVMVIVTTQTNDMAVFFDQCEDKARLVNRSDFSFIDKTHVFVCRGPKVPAEDIWSSMKSFR